MLKRTGVLWLLAALITGSSMVFQNITGPTHPVSGEAVIAGETVKYEFQRSHGGDADSKITLTVRNENITGILNYKRYKTDDLWTYKTMSRKGETIYDFLPHQPPAGKLMYNVTLVNGEERVDIPGNEPVIIRFRGHVPSIILAPHVIFIFLGMLISTRAGLEVLFRKQNIMTLAYWAAGLLFIGGMILGPIVQEYAFGDFWTGVPFGYDLTDNKMLISMLGWIAAIIAVRRGRNPRNWVLFASILTFIIFIIPHSVLGSELDYSKLPESKF